MIILLRYIALIIVTSINISCNGQGQTKSNSENVVDKNPKEKLNHPIQYNSGDVVTMGLLDKEGNMWFATTEEGVFKYNGGTFTNYSIEDGLCGNQVWAILEDQDGIIWFGTETGLCKYIGKKFENIPIPKDDTKSEWLRESYPIVNPNAVTSLIQDKNGVYWIGSNGAGVYRYDGSQFTSYLKERGKLMPDGLHHNVVLSIVEDRIGDIWFSSFSHGGISQYNGSDFIHHSLKDGFGDGMTSSIYMDKQGNLWVGTRNGGIYKYNGKSFINIPSGQTNDQIPMATFLEDSKGILWVSSYARKGVYQYDGKYIIPFEAKGSDKLTDVKCISEDKDGNIWFGGRYGILWRFDGNELKDFTLEKRKI
jgi:ligand-binding sensor domain-containing protein